MAQPIASLSLDLDNKWSYLKTHGDDGWDTFPSYLDVVVPRVLQLLERRGLKITFFVVGQDAALESNQAVLRSIADAGHEIGNHSFAHEPWLHLYKPEEIAAELERAEAAIFAATECRPMGFRGPGFSCSPAVLEELGRRGYAYDASTFPTFLGPFARLYYFLTANLSQEQKEQRKVLFGKFREGFRPLRPYVCRSREGEVMEIPVTTMPIFKSPIHVSYLMYLGLYSPALAAGYFAAALGMCRIMGISPSILLHPLDFLGCDDEKELSFFPAMKLPRDRKLALLDRALDQLENRYRIVTMSEHAAIAARSVRAAFVPPQKHAVFSDAS